MNPPEDTPRAGAVCPACGRAAPAWQRCPWCGERVPLTRQMRFEAALFALTLLALLPPFPEPMFAVGALFAAGLLGGSAPRPQAAVPAARRAAFGAWLCVEVLLLLAVSQLGTFFDPLEEAVRLLPLLGIAPALSLVARGGIPPVLPGRTRLHSLVCQFAFPLIALGAFAAFSFRAGGALPLAYAAGVWSRRVSPRATGLFLLAVGCRNPREIPLLLAGMLAGICMLLLLERRKRR